MSSPFNPPMILNRDQWHMPGPVGPKMKLPVQTVFLHHTVTHVTSRPVDDAATVAREGIARFGRMSYSVLVHPARGIFGAQLEREGVHTLGHNPTSLSVSLIGNYDVDDVPDSMVYDACVALHVLRSFGLTIDRPLVLPHQAVRATACPGRHAVATVLPFMRAVAADPTWRP